MGWLWWYQQAEAFGEGKYLDFQMLKHRIDEGKNR